MEGPNPGCLLVMSHVSSLSVSTCGIVCCLPHMCVMSH